MKDTRGIVEAPFLSKSRVCGDGFLHSLSHFAGCLETRKLMLRRFRLTAVRDLRSYEAIQASDGAIRRLSPSQRNGSFPLWAPTAIPSIWIWM